MVEDDDGDADRDALGSPVSKICFGKVRCATLLLVKIWVACANSDIEQNIFLRPRQGPQANSDIEQSALLRPRQGPQVFFFIRTHYSPIFSSWQNDPWVMLAEPDARSHQSHINLRSHQSHLTLQRHQKQNCRRMESRAYIMAGDHFSFACKPIANPSTP